MWRSLLIPLAFLPGTLQGQNPVSVVDGVRYQHRVQQDPPLSIHLVEVDPHKHRISVARALNSGLGRETVSSIARRRGALVAVNGGFFAIGGRYEGDPAGPLRIDGEWYSDSSLGRGAIGWDPQGKVFIERISVRWYLELGNDRFYFTGINQERGPKEAILYTWAFHRSTLTDPGGLEWAIKDGRIENIWRDGDARIPVDGYVVSFGPQFSLASLEGFVAGSPVALHWQITGPDEGVQERWQALPQVVGGTPVLLAGGEPLPDLALERVRPSFVDERHPRTAVCIKPGGNWLLVVVDGRQPHLSQGMSLKELTEFLQKELCQSALNLDGGGSTTLVIQDEVKNSPSEFGVERPVSDALLVLAQPPL